MLRARAWAFALCLVGFAALVVACDSVQGIHYENKTNERLFVQVNGDGVDALSPGKSVDYDYLATLIGSDDDRLHILVVDVHGCTVLKVDTTVARFRKEHDFSLVINQTDLPPVGARTPCDPALADIATRTQD